jgi:rhodanese-related sulfurtransferase
MKLRFQFFAVLIGITVHISPIHAGDWNALVSGSKVTGFLVEGTKKVDAQAARTLFDQGVPFVDFRTHDSWAAGHVPGAILCGSVTESNITSIVSKGEPVVFYCDGSDCRSAADASAMAIDWGFQSVYYFADGYAAWVDAGNPVE